MQPELFARIAESLRQYRRADLADFQQEIGGNPLDVLYVDPLPNDAVLRSVLSSNTTFLVGRKGTGKSTVFAKAQSSIRETNDLLSIYIDVKSLNELSQAPATQPQGIDSGDDLNNDVLSAHLLRKHFLASVLRQLLQEVNAQLDSLSIVERWKSKRKLEELKARFTELSQQIRNNRLQDHELPALRQIQQKQRTRLAESDATNDSVGSNAGISPVGPSAAVYAQTEQFEQSLEDNDLYREYSSVVFQSFPFQDIIEEIRDLIDGAGMRRLVVFFDDFSELHLLDQRLFVDVVLAPLNNASHEKIKLKVAGYPGRVYYGRIDPTKVDTLCLDFSSLYEAPEVQEMERNAIDYAQRLLETRFRTFGIDPAEYFDTSTSMDEYYALLFRTTFNVPRLMGALLHQCYLDRIAHGERINPQYIRLAARKYYEHTVSQYFDKMMRYALEPFENKLDRHNQKELLDFLIKEARDVRRRILAGEIGGTYFAELSDPPVSHFVVSPSLEDLFSSLESNFLVSKYKETRDKNGDKVIVYALFYGLAETERFSWGYPAGRKYRNYFVQRCFDFSRAIHEFLSNKQTIRCPACGASHPLEKKPAFELYNWICPECKEGTCEVVDLSAGLSLEVQKLDKEIMLEPVELEILAVLDEETGPMRAGEIAALIDVTYQLVGRRTSKLQDLNLVDKTINPRDGHRRSAITERGKTTYFSDD